MMAENGDVEAPSYEDWMKELHFVQTVKKATPKAVAKQPATEDKTTKLLDSVQSTLNENRRVQNRMDYAMGKTGLKTPETNLGWKGKSTLGFGGNVVETKRRNYVTGGEEKVYLTESGNEYGSRAMADVEQGQLDEARFMRENKRAYLMREKERIEREMNQRRGEVKRAKEEKYKKIWDDPLKYLSSMPRGGSVGFNPSVDNSGVWGDKKYKTLNAQLKQVEDALATLDEAEAGKKSDAWIADSSNAWERNAKKLAGFGGGAWRGLAHSVGKISTWDFGITDMETNKSVLDAANAVDKGTEATKEDQELLDLVAYKNMVGKESEPYLGYGYTAGSITGESLPFMLEMAINPASGVGKGAMKASMRGMLKKYGKEKLKSNFKKYLLAKAGARVAGDVAGAHAMALTTGQGRVIADTMRRLTGDVQYGVNDNGQIVYSGRKVDVDGLAEAYLKSFESQAIENHSEMLGEYFAPLLTRAGKAIGKPIGKGLEKLRLGGVNRFIEDVGASKTAKLIDDFSKKTQWNGSIGEYAEEVAGGIENAMIVGDQTLDTDEQTGVFNLEKNIETFLGVGLMGGFMFGAKLASYRGPKRGALQEMEAAGNRVDRALGGKMQARAQWGEWRSKLLLGNAEEKKNTLREIMDNEKLPIQFRNAVADFSRAAQKYEGLCRAEQSKRLEGTADPVGSSLDDAADAGYELNDPQEMTRTRLALENERERMAAYLGVEVDQVDATVGENLFDYVDDLRNRGVTGEELNRVMDYARARSRYEGMQMRLEDDTNTRIDNVHTNMARYAHRENGTVQTGAVKTKDGSRPVWIVSGNLVFEGEGKNRGVNPVKSDESIFVIDAKTGQVEMHPATDFVSLGEPVSAEEVNAYYESSVREQMKKAFEANTHAELSEEKPAEDGELAPANETEGAAVEPAEGNATESTAENATEPAKPAYEVGDVVTLETEEGPVSVEVQAVTADGVEVRTDEPWRGQVVQVIPTEEFEGMMKKPVVEGETGGTEGETGGVEESSATESDHYTEGSPERVEAGDNLIVTDEEGNDRSLKVVRRVSMKPSEKGGLEPQEDANGKIVELVDDATGETVRMWDSELAERTKGYMRPQQGVMPSPKSAEGEGVEQAEQAAPAQPKRNEIPVDEKTGEPVYEAADPGAAWDALVEEAEGDEELAMEAVNSMVRDMEEKLKKAKNAKLRAGATAHEKMEAQKERKRRIAEAEERLEAWKRIAGVKAERAAAAEAPVAESPAVESPAVESPVVESPVAESPATVETPAAEEATPVQEGAQTPVQEGARGGVQVPHADSAGQEATQDSVTGTAPVAEQTGTTPKGVEAIPTRKNNKGEEEVLYHKVPVARTMADLYDGGMDQEEIDGFVEANSAEAAREVKRIEGKKPKMTTNKAKYMEAKRAWQAELDEAREKEAYWKEVGKEVKRVTHRDEAPVSAEGRGHEAALGEDMPKDEPMDVYEVVASALGRGRIKITPESFRAETGYSVNDQKKYPGMVASAENGGVSVERAAEMLMEDADMAGFPSDDYTIRQAIIDVLQDGHPAGYISRRREEARRRAAERDEREREDYYQDRYGMNADDGMAYEETAVPNALNQYGGVSEDELAAQSAEAAEAAEAERMKREEDEQGNRAEDGGQQMAGKEEDAGNEAASEVEEGGRQMEGEEKADTFSLSEMDSGKGGRLYQDAAGNTNLVSIPNEVFEAMGMSPVPFSLTESMAEHVLKHKTELGLSSKEDAVRYVVAVMKNADHVRAGDKPGSFVFSVENGRRKVGKRAIAVQVDGSSGKFLGISTSGNERVSNLQKRPLLWEKGVNETSATGSAPANVTSETAEQNGGELDGNASNQSNDLSADKVTESKETEQVGARVKAEGEEAEVSKDETPKEYKYRRNSDIDTLPDGYLRLGKDERGFDVAFYDHPLSRKEVERFHMGPITESNELVGKVYEVTRGLVTITYRVVGAEDGFVLFTDNGSFDYRTLPYYKFMDWVVAKGKEVGTEVKASGKAREARAKDGTQPVSESEAGLRDALVDVARAAGVEVVTDSKEGQRVLDEVNGKARKMAFGEEYDYNQFPVGRVEPELLSRSVEIVPAEKNHGFANYDEAKTWAKDHIVRTLTNEESGGKGRVKISGAAVGKYLSESAVAKSDNRDVHLAVLRVLPDVICKSIEVETTPDFKKDENGVRKAGNEINKDVLIHRCYGAVEIDGQVYRVKVTLKEYRDENEDNKAYSYEATKIELLAGTLANDRNSTTDPGTNSSLSAAKLLNGVMMSYDSSKNVLDESAKMSALVREHRVFHGSGAEFDAFDHSHMGEGEGARFFKTENGEAYGFTVGGKVYLDPKIATTETAVHELTHLWADMLRKENPKEWKHVVELMKGTPVWDEVKAKYPELKTEDEIADEVLAHYSGRRGAERLRAEQQRLAREEGVSMLDRASAVAAIERVKDALNSFWKKVADLLGIHFKSAEEVADAALADILNGRVKPQHIGNDSSMSVSDFAAKHDVNKEDVKKYAQSMKAGNLGGASYAFKNIKRSIWLANDNLSLSAFVKVFSPVRDELYSLFGNIDELRNEHIKIEMDNRNAMEAARKREEEQAEAERKRLEEFELMSDESLDKAYMEAVRSNDEKRMRDLVNEAARRKGYLSTDEFRMSHRAPSYDEEGVDKSMIDIASNKDSIRDSLEEQSRMNRDKNREDSIAAISQALQEIEKGNIPDVTIYRAVPKSLKEGSVRNGDWVTLSESYAKQHGNHALNGEYRIMKEVVPADNLYWDGNDINEWGYDDKRDYVYRNTRNNRKLNELVVRDDKGEIIPLSKRFNSRKKDVRFQLVGEKGEKNMVSPLEMSEEEKHERGVQLVNAPAVDVASGQIVKTDKLSARKAAEQWWEESVGKSLYFETEVGQVEIDKSSIKDSLSHGYRQEKLDAIASLPEGFKNAVYIGSMDDFKRPGVVNHYFAYPINYGNQRRYVFCRAMADNNKNRLYVHEVFMGDSIKESDTLQTIASASLDGELHGGVALYKAILKNVLDAAKVVEEFENPNVQGQETDDASYREVEQGELLDELRKASKEGRTVRVYRTMQVIDGKLYSPMAKKVAGQETSEIKFRWEAAEEHPELARRGDGSKAMPNEDSFYITIDKGQGKGALTVAYNPYTHTSRTVLNDQFSSAFVRPNLVVVEVEVPESELEGLYKAEKAKDSVGEMSWHSGAVSGKLAELGNPRKVILSRYDRPVRILTKKEEAELIAKQLEGTGIAMPYNLVTPQVREELEKLGVKIDEKPSGSVSKNASFGKAEYVTDEQIEAMNGRLQANAVSSPEAMTEAARALSEQLGVPVEIVTDVDSITHPNEAVEVKRRRAKGWYDKRTGKVAIVVPNHLDVEDVAATVFHEVVAHRGLRELVGEQGYDEFLMEVFNHSKADVREHMMALAGKHGWDIPKAVDEYLGGLAERGFGDFSEAERGMWTWLKEKVLEAIDKFIGTLKLPKSVKLGDNELRYLLWRSHENLRAGREGMVKRAMDVAKRYELGLLENEAGERMIDGLETYRSAENRGNTRALPIRERAKAVAHLKPVLVERNEMSKEELRQIYNALPDAVKDGRSISFFHSAFKKNYKEGGLFAQVLPKLNEILKGSVFAYSEKDNRGGEVRPDGTVHKYHPNANAFDNYVGKVEIDGKEYYVRITVQEQQGQVGTHSFFVTSVDVYEKPVNGLSVPNFPSGESDHQRVVDAKLRQFFDEARREDKASEEEDLYRTAYHEAAARDAYERRVKSGLYQSREALQDSMLGLRTAMEEVLKAEGNGYSGRVEDIPGFENAYLGENRLSSVNQAEVDEFGRRLFKPLLEIAASFGSSKEARQALTDYMMAKHGLERNALMRERAKKKAMEELEGDALQKKLDSIEKRDFAGLTALTGEKKVVDAEQAARKMVADFEQASGQNGDPNRIDKLWKAMRGVTGATLKKMKDSGLITKEQFDEISGMYDFYIPLRGFDGQTAEDVYDYLGHGGNGSAFTSPIKKAEGRKSKADDPFAYMAAMAESAIMQGNRNVLVKQKFLNFVLNHPSDLVSVSDLWLRYDSAAGEWRVAQSGDIVGTEKLEEGDSPEEVERKMAVFEERMQAEAEAHPKEYKRQKEHPEIPYRVVEKQDLREHQVIVKRNGRDYVLTINGSPRAAQALNGLTNPNLDVSGVAGTLMNGVRNTTNYLSQVYTTRNPNFVGSNWARDAIYSNIMAGLKEDGEYGLEFSKAWLEANPGSMSKLYYLYEHGELDMNNEKQRLFAEFMANGGETGYMSFRQIEERKNEIERQLKLYGGKMSLKKGWSDAWNLVDYANRVVENQSRFAAYMASRRSGRTIDRSIYDAKEITVNFNKKGAGSTFYNAKNQTLAGKVAGGVSGIGRFGFAFWNAAIQGTTNFARFVKRNPKKGVAFSLATMALGYVVPLLASIFHDDDDDKEGSGYFDLPDAVRRDNFVFRFPGMDSWITIPLPVEYRALYGLGELTATAMYRASIGMPMTAGEIAGQAMGQISQLMPLDLSEGGGMDFTWGASGNFNALAPSAVKPVAEAWTNKSWTGLPVYKDTPYNKQDPEWTKAFKNTNTFLVKMCKQLNEWTGGDSVKGGAVDLNPAVMEHLLKGYLGGYMQTANQFGKLGETVFGDRENEFRNWPVVSRFLQEGDERTKWRAVTERYFNLKKEAEETDRQLKRYKRLTELGEDHQADIDELIKTDAYKRMEVYDFFENDIQKIQDVLKRNDLSDEERKQVEGELNEIRLELLKAVDELGNLTGLGTGRLGAVTGDLLAE